MAELAVDVLCFHRVTVADGVKPPDQSLHGSHAHGHQAHQVEHDAVENLHFPEGKEPTLLLLCLDWYTSHVKRRQPEKPVCLNKGSTEFFLNM